MLLNNDLEVMYILLIIHIGSFWKILSCKRIPNVHKKLRIQKFLCITSNFKLLIVFYNFPDILPRLVTRPKRFIKCPIFITYYIVDF